MSSSHHIDGRSAAAGREDPDLEWIDHRVAQRLFGGAQRQIGRYRVLGVLGSGGMGVVYLATDDRLQRRVALKLLNAGSRTPEGVERLLREARAMARLSHPSVVQIYEVGVHDDHVFIAMECVPGRTLADWHGEASRPWKLVRDLFVAVAQGVCAAHAMGIVHRDLKPSNILIDPEGRPKVADFGLARIDDETATTSTDDTLPDATHRSAPDLTLPGVRVGTPRYMAPEQATSFASDQYSYCVVLWEHLYRQHPFEAADADEMLAAKRAGAVRPPPRDARVPARIRRILLRGLHPAPAARWPSMLALLERLKRDPWPRRHPWMLALAGVLLTPAALAARQLAQEVPGQTCQAAATRRSAELWAPATAEALARKFAEADPDIGADAAWRALSRGIDTYTEQWVQAQQTLCTLAAHPEALAGQHRASARRQQCLDHRLLALQGFLSALQDTPPAAPASDLYAPTLDPGARPGAVHPVLDVKLRLPAIAACERTARPAADDMIAVVPSTSAAARARVGALARVQALEALGHHEPARRLLHDLLPALRTDGPADLLPESEYMQGRLLRRTGPADAAEDALVRAEQLAEGAWRDDLLVAVRLDLARLSLDDRATLTAKERQAQLRRGEREYGRASAIFVRDGGDPGSDRDFLEVAALLAMRAGEEDRALQLRERALGGGSGPDDAALDAQFLGQLANRLAASGELDAAIDVDGEAVDRAWRGLGETHHVTVDVAFNAAGRLLRRGSLDAGQDALALVLRAAPGPRGRAEYAAGSLLLYAGESELAWPYAERAAAIARQRQDALQLAHALHLQAEILLRRGDHEAAHRAAEAAIAAIPTIMPAPDALLLRRQLEVHRAETLIYVRRGAEALEQVGRSRRELAATGEPILDDLSARLRLVEAQALTLLGRHEAAASALSPASAHAQLCDRLSDRLKVGDVHALAAQLQRARHKHRSADTHDRIAMDRYRAAGRDGTHRIATGTPWSAPLDPGDGALH